MASGAAHLGALEAAGSIIAASRRLGWGELGRLPALHRSKSLLLASYFVPRPRWPVGHTLSTCATLEDVVGIICRPLRHSLCRLWCSRRAWHAVKLVRAFAHVRLARYRGLHGRLVVSFGLISP